jgi:hypothetical protein
VDAWLVAELLLLGALVAALVRLAPLPLAAGAVAGLGCGWLLLGWGFWGYALAAVAAALSARIAAAADLGGRAARP